MPPSYARLALAALAPLAVALAAGCGAPPPPADPPDPPATPGSAGPTGSVPAFPTPTAPGLPGSPSAGFGEEVATSCGSQPGAGQVLALLRDEGMLGPGTEAEVTDGPYCAGSWQYAVVTVADRDPLQVVTRGEPDALELVTAGTDVCSVEVRIQAPPGIRTAAACVG